MPLRADQSVARAYFPNNLPPNLELTEDAIEHPATHLPAPNDIVDVETAWRLPER